MPIGVVVRTDLSGVGKAPNLPLETGLVVVAIAEGVPLCVVAVGNLAAAVAEMPTEVGSGEYSASCGLANNDLLLLFIDDGDSIREGVAIAAGAVGCEGSSNPADKTDESPGEFCRLLIVTAMNVDCGAALRARSADSGVSHFDVAVLEEEGGDSPVGELGVVLDCGEDGLSLKLFLECVAPSATQETMGGDEGVSRKFF